MEEVPFQLSVEDAGNFWILWQRPTSFWMRMPETWKRVGAAIALDLMLPLFAEKIYQIARDYAPIEEADKIVWRSEPTQEIPARWTIYPEELLSNMEEWTALWEREPSLNSSEVRKRYLARRFFHDLGWALPMVLIQPPIGGMEELSWHKILNLRDSWLDFIDPYDDIEDRHEEYNFKPTMTIMKTITAIALDPLPIPMDCEQPTQRTTAWTCMSPSYGTAEERTAALLQVTKPLEHWYGIWWREFQNSIPIKEQAGIR